MKLFHAQWRYLCLFALLCHGQWSLAMGDATTEYKVKAGYLYNFTKFVTWPEDNSSSFNICIVGTDHFGHAIDVIEQKTAFGRPIKLFKLNVFKPDQRCHILYISSSSTAPDIAIRNGNSTLTVGEDGAFIERDGMIGFVNRNGKIKLQINLHILKQSGLKISAKLLEVAELIEDGDD